MTATQHRGRKLDRLYKPDLRSLNFLIRDVVEADPRYKPRSYTWYLDPMIRLNQGSEGACVFFGWSHELAARPVQVPGITEAFAFAGYHRAKQIDEWVGEDYDGTSVNAGAKVARELGFITEWRWCLDIWDVIKSLGYFGPVVIGVDWYEGMWDVDANGFIRPTGHIVGGHCVSLTAIRIVFKPRASIDAPLEVDLVRSYATGINSWGRSWGRDGFFKIALIDLALLIPGGDFCIPMGRSL